MEGESTPAAADGPLQGITVIDLSRALAGPHAAMMLGDLGARVIKVETPNGGDESRSWGTIVGPAENPESTYFLSCNRNKESVTADLKTTDGVELLTRLTQTADVLIENFRPGVMDRLGFSATRLHQLNPRLVVLSISGFGHDGPQGGRAGYDQIAQGEAGLMSLTGPDAETPLRVGTPIGDVLAGMYGAFGVVAALQGRERTGQGDIVRTSLLGAIVGVHAFHGTRYTVAGEVGHGTGNQHPAIAPYGLFHCADGALQVAVANDGLWRKFCDIVDLNADDPRFVNNAARFTHRDDLTTDIEQRLATNTRSHWLKLLDDAGIPCGQVRSLDQVYNDEQTRSQGLLLTVEHDALGEITIPGPPLRFQHNPRRAHTAPPQLGQHNTTVRTWLKDIDHVH
ncbi:crotonobetainyl-CoA:carnitine CoA-transferase CaiB-like acyl-CoA transferase [Prauserella sediminis]|uniref:Crotonobetainyl-CoA:carnitine CoA-transferase CaiB-like acyl-CoA transferase n=1 Tax=Prauserella sediminis TaxID=577680 RepID=A0A839XWU6_9PSEU|nr:CoA transferase [Prauserella sediminis]MBB3664496.1 crotonobetainyl-CoA:carnitine CoA-transferase CaiB-like acyl-CoA transferase [Prauserella sediminis]